jgi:hypothetical protein
LRAPRQTKERNRLNRKKASMLRSPQNDTSLKEEMSGCAIFPMHCMTCTFLG